MTATSRSDYEHSTRRTVAYGVTAFAGIMLATVAVFQILEGIAALANDQVYVTGIHYVYEFDVTAWGWIHLVIGIIGVATGIGILLGQTWGRVVGITIAVLGALSNFAFVPYYPIWSLIIVAFYGFVIWALCLQVSHGDRF